MIMGFGKYILSKFNKWMKNITLFNHGLIPMEELQTKLAMVNEIASFCFWEWDNTSQKIIFSSDSCDFIEDNKEIAIKDLHGLIDAYVTPDDINQIKQYCKNLKENQTNNSIEFSLLLPGEIKKYIRVKSRTFSKNNIIGILFDLTEWKSKELLLDERLNFADTVMETIPNPVFYKDSNLIYKYCNDSFCKYLGLKKEQIINHTIFEIRAKELANVIHQGDLQLMSCKSALSYQMELPNIDGTTHHVIFNKAALLHSDGTFEGIVGVANDVTEQVESEQKIQRLIKLKDAVLEINNSVMDINDLNELFDFILKKVLFSMDHVDLGCILLLGEDRRFTIEASIGYLESEAKDFNLKLEDSIQWRITNGHINETIVINDLDQHKETQFLKNKTGLKIKSFMSAPIIIDGKLYGILNIDSSRNNVFDEEDFAMMEYLRRQLVFAINQFKLYENITYLSEHDANTGLYNRGHFEKLYHTISCHAFKNNETFSVILFDLNGLKHVNDTYGHLAGDALILHFATTLKDWIKDSDILARYGGDEFIALIFGSNNNSIIDRLENLRLLFEDNPIHHEDTPIVCSFSYGIAEFPYHSTDYDRLVEVADKNMYLYKGYLKGYSEND